jgi:hypothetical protein
MASIADVFVSVLPETSKIAAGIERALRNVDLRKIAREWERTIERETKPTVELKADTRPAERKIDELEPDRDRALEPAVRPRDAPGCSGACYHEQRAAAGVGHVIASGAVALDTDTRGVDVQWSENATADSFGKNLMFARCESRYATSVFSPLGVVSLDLTA